MPHSKNKKAPSVIGIVKNLALYYLKRLDNVARLASLEARLARKTIAALTLLIIVMGFLLISTWASLLLLLFVFILSLHYSMLVASLVIVVLNLILLLALYLYMGKIKKNLFFPATRRQLSNIVSKD